MLENVTPTQAQMLGSLGVRLPLGEADACIWPGLVHTLLQEEALKWIRETLGIFITAETWLSGRWSAKVDFCKFDLVEFVTTSDTGEAWIVDSYEEAISIGLDYVLDNLMRFRRLNHDFDRCEGRKCTIKTGCARFWGAIHLAAEDDPRFVLATAKDHEMNGECKLYIPLEDKAQKEEKVISPSKA